MFVKDSRGSGGNGGHLDSDEDPAVNERLQDVVGDITTSFSAARHNSESISPFYVTADACRNDSATFSASCISSDAKSGVLLWTLSRSIADRAVLISVS